MKTAPLDQQRLDLIARVARLYHEEGRNLREIGAKLSISPSTVSRLLAEAHELRIVEVVIRYPLLTDSPLGKELRDRLRLKAAYVLPQVRGTYDGMIDRLAQIAARTLEDALEDGMTLGISLGRAVAATARAFKISQAIRCKVIRLQGANKDELLEGTDLAQIFSVHLGGEFKIIPSPWILKSTEACELILQEPSVRDVIHEAENTDIGLVGMGSMDPEVSTIFRNKLISIRELRALRDLGAVGDICGKYYDLSGNVLDVDFNRRTVSIDIEKLRLVDTVIGVAAGPSKVTAILGAIHGRLINVLITDSEAAMLLLEQNGR